MRGTSYDEESAEQSELLFVKINNISDSEEASGTYLLAETQ